MKIDFVFLYVNGYEPKYIEKKNKYLKKEHIKSNPNCRYEDVGEIKYSVNSVIKNLSWINKIYIITDNQIPPIDQKLIKNGKVNIIDHKQIILKKYLPTFYSDVIESCIHNIPKLSDIFLYGNDDYFCFSKMKKSDFVKNNKLIIYTEQHSSNILHLYSYSNEYRLRIYLTSKLLQKKKIVNNDIFINSHQIKIFRKKTLKKIEIDFDCELDKLRKNKFRNNTTINYNFLVMNYEQYLYNNILIKLDFNNSLNIINKKQFQILFFLLNYNIINIDFFKKKFVCINYLDYSLKDKFVKLIKLIQN